MTGSKIDGVKFTTGRPRMGFTACQSTAWQSDSSLVCRAPQGIASSMIAVATVGQQSGSLTEAWSIDAPLLTSVVQINLAVGAEATISLRGSNMGTTVYTSQLRSRMGDTGCEGTAWVSDTAVSARMTASAFLGSLRAAITAGHQAGSLTEAWSTDATAVQATSGNVAVGGALQVTVHGAIAGHAYYTIAARTGVSGCEASAWVSETTVMCQAGTSTRSSLSTVVTAGQVEGSMTFAFSTDAATVASSSTPGNLPSGG